MITDDFLQYIADEGALAKAARRLSRMKPADIARLTHRSTWSLVREEILDTEHSEEHYDRVVNELHCRGLTDPEIRDMRVFAWETAGWLNFEKMLWDWVSLTERDILLAINWLQKEGEITERESEEMRAFVKRYDPEATAWQLEDRTN